MGNINFDYQKLLKYWRSSLADSALGKGCFNDGDTKKLMELSKETIGSGVLPDNQLRKVFEGKKPETKIIAVRLWPMVAKRKKSHGTTISNGYPEMVAPVVSEALVDREGNIRPTRNVIARDVLTPLPDDVFSLGDIDDFDEFITVNPFSPNENTPIWKQYKEHSRAMLDAISLDWPSSDPNYKFAGFGFLEVADDFSAAIDKIISLYDNITSQKPDAPLLKKLTE